MHFKHPELLYALFLLVIPIIIHLFQLRRFQKVDFTNVAFLKKVTIQTRKSSQLKKWLTLLMRLAAMACLIIAFAQPFSASKTALDTKKETVLYLDNSFSMELKGAKGPMLQRALQDIYKQSSGSEKISWFTNNDIHKNDAVTDFKDALLKVTYSQNQLSPTEVILKGNQLFSKDKATTKRLLYVSDFQQKDRFPEVREEFKIDAVHLKPSINSNIAIDTAFISSKNATSFKLEVTISSQGENNKDVPVSLYNENTLVAKTAVDFSNGNKTNISFDIKNTGSFNGRLELIEPNLTFDNSLFFSINTPKKLKVLAINEANAQFLQRIFNQEEFEYKQNSFKDLNYSEIPEQNFIILNELKTIPQSIITALKSFKENGGSLFIIPSKDADISSYNSLLATLQLGSLSEINPFEKKITQIIFDHPLYQNVFEKRIVNFQYPKVNSFFALSSNTTSALLFEDGKPFIVQQGDVYLCTAAINSENSNFQSSPLIVPTLYNMAIQSLPLPELYYNIGQQNNFSIPVSLVNDEILTLKDSLNSFIPLQQTKANKVTISTTDSPADAGIYQIENKGEFIENVSYNYSREESTLLYADPSSWDGVTVFNSVDELFSSIAEENTINSFWKWFAIFALLFLLFEMLILKFYK